MMDILHMLIQIIFIPPLNIILFLYSNLHGCNATEEIHIPNISYYKGYIFLSPNSCFHTNQYMYNIMCKFPVSVLYNTTVNIVVETARQELNNGNISYHYFTQGVEPFIMSYYWKTERLKDDSYKVCSADNSSLTLKTLPWKSLTHIEDFDRKIFTKKRYLESYAEHLELRMCSKIFINASHLQELSIIEKWCYIPEGPKFDYYPRTYCFRSHFHCYSGECIPGEWRFDGEIDCFDGSDEQKCEDPQHCGLSTYTCGKENNLPIFNRCNGHVDCEDGSDEHNCTDAEIRAIGNHPCDSSYVPVYLEKAMVCDGNINCPSGSDEMNCTGEDIYKRTDKHECGDEKILYYLSLCNDHFGCEDHSDEDNCFGDKIHAPQLKKISLDYRTMMTTNFTKQTQNSITHLTIYKSSSYNIYNKLDLKRIILRTLSFSNLQFLNLSHTVFYPSSQFDISHISMKSVENLNISYCDIETFDDIPLYVFKYLRVLDISHNKIKEIYTSLFFEMKHLVYLNISESLIPTDVMLQFNSLNKMNLVDFSNNKLEEVSLSFTKGILGIDLSKNPLKYNTINLHSDSPLAIDRLTLHDNKIDINTLLIEKLKNVKAIDIQNYTLDCSDCRILKSAVFSESYSGISVILNGTNHTPVCTLPDKYKGESVHKVNVNEYCPNPLIKTAITVSSVIGVALITCIIVAYKFRFELMYYIQYAKLKTRKMTTNNCDTEGYEYDAFVSYCAADREWVWDVLHPGLEDCPQKFCLCLHDRDFKLGTHIFDNIDHSFQKSKFCVMIISNCFIKSHWCRFELEVASMKLIQENRDFLILVQLEKLDSCNIPRHLAYLLSTRTYLEWNIEKFSEDMLLERLREALGRSIFERNQETTENTSVELMDTNV